MPPSGTALLSVHVAHNAVQMAGLLQALQSVWYLEHMLLFTLPLKTGAIIHDSWHSCLLKAGTAHRAAHAIHCAVV